MFRRIALVALLAVAALGATERRPSPPSPPRGRRGHCTAATVWKLSSAPKAADRGRVPGRPEPKQPPVAGHDQRQRPHGLPHIALHAGTLRFVHRAPTHHEPRRDRSDHGQGDQRRDRRGVPSDSTSDLLADTDQDRRPPLTGGPAVDAQRVAVTRGRHRSTHQEAMCQEHDGSRIDHPPGGRRVVSELAPSSPQSPCRGVPGEWRRRDAGVRGHAHPERSSRRVGHGSRRPVGVVHADRGGHSRTGRRDGDASRGHRSTNGWLGRRLR